jgi:RimJ/RimL family protein N-acetyltransferase
MMEAMLYHDHSGRPVEDVLPADPVVASDWHTGLPLIAGDGVTLRELRLSDAATLFAMLTTEEVSRFISPPPTTVAGFERFIAWTIRQRRAGEYICFGIVPDGGESAIGLIQVRAQHGQWDTAEWGLRSGRRTVEPACSSRP